ncbi:MAG: MlaD family protein [Kiritimatiellia bacterium]
MKGKNDAFAQAVVGVFMVTVLLLLGYFTIVISGADLLSGRERMRLSAAFDQVGGLKERDNVMYRGTKVGTVERVIVTPSNLVVVAGVSRGVVLRQGYRLTVCNQSMLGGNYLLMEEGVGEQIDAAATLLRGEAPTDWLADASQTVRNLRTLTERLDLEGIVTNLEAASVAAKTIAQRVERGEGLVGKLTAGNDDLYAELCETVRNAKEISARFNQRSLYGELEATIADFRTMCSNITAASANIERASRGLDLQTPLAKLDAFLTDSGELAKNLNEVSARLRAGEGTLGRLVADDRLYRELEGLIRDCRQVLDNYRDTTPISTFSSLATGAL